MECRGQRRGVSGRRIDIKVDCLVKTLKVPWTLVIADRQPCGQRVAQIGLDLAANTIELLFEGIFGARIQVPEPAVAVFGLARQAETDSIRKRAANRRLGIKGVEPAVADFGVAFELVARLLGYETGQSAA